MDLFVGVDIGQKREPSGLCVAEFEWRPNAEREDEHYIVRRLERIDAGTSYPKIAERVGSVVTALDRRTGSCPQVFVDATGLGDPVIDLINARLPCSRASAVYFNYGDRRLADDLEVRLGKAWLVTRLQALLQAGRLHLSRTPGADTLAEELLDYHVCVDRSDSEREGAFRVGTRDELVTALGLAVQTEPSRPGIF